MGRVMQCSQTQLERSPLPGGSGLAGLRRMPPEPQSAAGQQWHHPAAGNRNRNSLKHGNAQLRHETTTLCWKRMNLRIHICCSQNIWNVIILADLRTECWQTCVWYWQPSTSQTKISYKEHRRSFSRTQKSLLHCFRLLPFCIMTPFTAWLFTAKWSRFLSRLVSYNKGHTFLPAQKSSKDYRLHLCHLCIIASSHHWPSRMILRGCKSS